MTTEKTEKKQSEETVEGFGCCCPPQFREMLETFTQGDKEACFEKMQEMMKGGCCSPQK